jgi:hypothetical protein
MIIKNIRTSGGIFSHHFIESLQQESFKHSACTPESFTVPGQDRLSENELEKQIANAWSSLVERWDAVEREFGSLDISAIRQKWLLPLFYFLKFAPDYQRADLVLEGDLRFPVSYLARAGTSEFSIPIHTILYSSEDTLDARTGSGRGIKNLAPHDMLQRFVNLSKDYTWAILSDGVYLRLLRDFRHTYTRGFVEFDLQGIFSSRDFSAFRALYRLLHASRFIKAEGRENNPIDELYEDSLAMGVKVGEDLRKNVQQAIESLANGFLGSSPGFLEKVREMENGAHLLYKDVLTTIYRMLFMLFAEQHGMLPGRGSLYIEEYSMTALRSIAEISMGEDQNSDLWEKFKTTIAMLEHGVIELGIFAYNGALFSLGRTPLLTPEEEYIAPQCRNDQFLHAVYQLTMVEKEKVKQRISYADLSVEEIGSIYEGLLEFTPCITETVEKVDDRQIPANTFFLDPRGSGRKTTGSYYTPPSLVNELIKSALVPVMEARIQEVVPGYDSEYVEALSEEEQKLAEEAILKIKVVDPAAGSGAFLIAANNKLGLELARIRTRETLPSEHEIRKARRDVLANCIFAVDLNPMAVELCKVSLWINAAVKDAPLNFLDHHIKCGNSLVGANQELINAGIPDDAYQPLTGDDKYIAKAIKAQNQGELKGQIGLLRVTTLNNEDDLQKWIQISQLAEDDPSQAEKDYYAYFNKENYWNQRLPYDLWTAAFFSPLRKNIYIPSTQDVFQAGLDISVVNHELITNVQKLADHFRFFHWHLEFPQVFGEDGSRGFDVVLSNPPWERVKLQEKEFFHGKDENIAGARNSSIRKALINKISDSNKSLHKEFETAVYESESISKFLRSSGVYPLTGVGDVNLYQVFAGRCRNLINDYGQSGIIVPTGIATDFTNRHFFADIVEEDQLVSLLDFENKKRLFPDVAAPVKFSLFTLRGKRIESKSTEASFAFFLYDVDEIDEGEKSFKLSKEDFQLLNPNTLTCPVFSTRTDANLTRKLFQRTSILINKEFDDNPWIISFSRPFDMSNDSNLFKTDKELESTNFELSGNTYSNGNVVYFPLYEAKLFHQYDHRYNTYKNVPNESKYNVKAYALPISDSDHVNPSTLTLPRYWLEQSNIIERWNDDSKNWTIAFRDITNRITNRRTAIFAILPKVGGNNVAPFIRTSVSNPALALCLYANLNSIVFDFVARQNVGGSHLSYYILEQLPVFRPDFYLNQSGKFKNFATRIIENVFELTYTSWDLICFSIEILEVLEDETRISIMQKQKENYSNLKKSEEINLPDWARHYLPQNEEKNNVFFSPFIWDNFRRHKIQCELDALYGHLYGITRDEFEYIFSSFPILKRKEEEQFGEYRSRLTTLEIFDKMESDPDLSEIGIPKIDQISVISNPEELTYIPNEYRLKGSHFSTAESYTKNNIRNKKNLSNEVQTKQGSLFD